MKDNHEEVIHLRDVNKKLLLEIEDLKCCGNCDHEDMSYGENDCEFKYNCSLYCRGGKKSFWKKYEKEQA